jgi:hypothetical protein
MGFSLSWIAINGMSPEKVQVALKLRGTGAREDVPDSPFAGAELPGGWYLVIADHDFPWFMHDAHLTHLSSGCEIVTCFVEEHVMMSSASGWKNGRHLWSVIHDLQRDIEHLETSGVLPPVFASIKDHAWNDQVSAGGRAAHVDHIFDVPMRLAHELTGFRHDHDIPELGVRPFEVLVPVVRTIRERSWWSKLAEKWTNR